MVAKMTEIGLWRNLLTGSLYHLRDIADVRFCCLGIMEYTYVGSKNCFPTPLIRVVIRKLLKLSIFVHLQFKALNICT